MKRYTYEVVVIHRHSVESLERQLNAYGAEGQRVVASFGFQTQAKVIAAFTKYG